MNRSLLRELSDSWPDLCLRGGVLWSLAFWPDRPTRPPHDIDFCLVSPGPLDAAILARRIAARLSQVCRDVRTDAHAVKGWHPSLKRLVDICYRESAVLPLSRYPELGEGMSLIESVAEKLQAALTRCPYRPIDDEDLAVFAKREPDLAERFLDPSSTEFATFLRKMTTPSKGLVRELNLARPRHDGLADKMAKLLYSSSLGNEFNPKSSGARLP